MRAPSPDTFRASRRTALRVRASGEDAAASPLEFDAMVRQSLLSKLPTESDPSLWGLFVKDGDEAVRHAVASSGPASLWETLAVDPSVWVRQAVARRAARSADHLSLTASLCQDASYWVRLAAVEGLVGQDHGASLLAERLHDDTPWLRATVLQDLPASVPSAVLAQMAQDDPVDWVRHMALRALALRDPAAARQALRGLPAARQGTLASVLRHFAPTLGERPGAALERYSFNQMQRPLGDKPLQVIQDLLLAPTGVPTGPTATKRAALISSAVRGWAHPARMGGDAPRQHALFFLNRPADADTIGNQVVAANLPDLDSAFTLLETLRGAPNPFARRMATQLLTRVPNARLTLPMLQSLLLDPDGQVRQEAARALQNICTKRDNPADCLVMARYLAASQDLQLRLRGVMMLAHIGTDETLPALTAAFYGDKSYSVRQEAVRGMVTNASPDAVNFLMAVTHDEDPGIRSFLAGVLEDERTPRIYPVLARLARDPSRPVLEALTHTLCKHVRDMAQTPVNSEAALRLLDIVDMVPNPAVCRQRSAVLPEALVAFKHDPAMVQMLHGWAARLTDVHLGVVERLAQADYPGRERVILSLLESQHEGVAREARAVINKQLNAGVKPETQEALGT